MTMCDGCCQSCSAMVKLQPQFSGAKLYVHVQIYIKAFGAYAHDFLHNNAHVLCPNKTFAHSGNGAGGAGRQHYLQQTGGQGLYMQRRL